MNAHSRTHQEHYNCVTRSRCQKAKVPPTYGLSLVRVGSGPYTSTNPPQKRATGCKNLSFEPMIDILREVL
jgi:hypothetical protein